MLIFLKSSISNSDIFKHISFIPPFPFCWKAALTLSCSRIPIIEPRDWKFEFYSYNLWLVRLRGKLLTAACSEVMYLDFDPQTKLEFVKFAKSAHTRLFGQIQGFGEETIFEEINQILWLWHLKATLMLH